MYTQARVQKFGELGHYENIDIPDADLRRAIPQPEPQAPQIHFPTATKNSHPLLIAGILIGLLAGIIAALPRAIRGWVVLAILGGILAGIGWFAWSIVHDVAAQNAYAGVESAYVFPADAPPMPSPTVEVRRAQLVKLPRK